MKNVNFYENIREATTRLVNTVVLYDKEPYKILGISNHKKDGIFRVYLFPISLDYDAMQRAYPPGIGNYGHDDPEVGLYMDKWMEQMGSKCVVLRKMANSPSFNSYRPFPLGMCNRDGLVLYYERQPQRHREQGLTRNSVIETLVDLGSTPQRGCQMNITGPEWHACITGDHPNIQECMKNMKDPSFEERQAVAFHRDFALIRGPLDSFFIGYKTEVVGSIPDFTTPSMVLGRKYRHLKEVAEASGCFTRVSVQS